MSPAPDPTQPDDPSRPDDPTGAAATGASPAPGSDTADVVVVGGGLGGLLAATALDRRGVRVVVLEAGERPGGVALAERRDGWLLEPAASSMLLPNPALTPLLDHAGATPVPADPAARRRYLYTRNRLVELAESPAVLLAPVVGPGAKLRALAEPLVRAPVGGAAPDESLAGFARRRFGSGVGDLLATVAAHGVFAGDPEQLSVRSCFPALPALEDAEGSVIRGGLARMRSRPKGTPRARVHVMADGMAELAATLAAHLGERFRPGHRIQSLERRGAAWHVQGPGWEVAAPTVVLATPTAVAATLAPPEVAEVLGRAQRAPVAVVGLGGPEALVPLPEGFGVLAGPGAGVRVLGVLFESRYAPGRAPEGHHLAKAILGGAADPGAYELDDDELVAQAGGDLARILGAPVRPSWTAVVRHAEGIPQYGRAHGAWLANLERTLAAQPGLHVAGWSYRGIGVSGLATDATALAERISP